MYVCEKISYMIKKEMTQRMRQFLFLFLFELHKMRHVTSEQCLAVYCCCQERFFLVERYNLMNLVLNK